MKLVKLTEVTLPSWGWHVADTEQDHKLHRSIAKHGLLTPLVVRSVNAHYEVIDGRRRYGIAQQLGFEVIAVMDAGEISEEEAIKVALSLELRSEIDYTSLARHIRPINQNGDLSFTTPFSAERLHYFNSLCYFDWDQYSTQVQDSFFDDEEEERYAPEPLPEPVVVSAPIVVMPPVTPAAPTTVLPPPIPRPVIPETPTTPAPLPSPAPTAPVAAPAALTAAPTVLSAAARLLALNQFSPIQGATVMVEPSVIPEAPEVDPWSEDPAPARPSIPDAPRGGVQFWGAEPIVSDFTPQEPPILDGIDEIVLNFETSGLRWWQGARPIGVTVGTLDGQLKRFLPFGFTGGNLDEAVVKRWAQEQLKHKRITNAHAGFEIHMAREWGVDLEEQGCTFSDPMHYAALLDEYRREFALDVLVKDFLGIDGPPRVDESRMATYHARDVAVRAEFQVEAVAKLRAVMYPLLEAEGLHRVRELEDDVIPVVCEMEKNAAFVNRTRLKEMVLKSGEMLNQALWEVARDLGFSMNPDKNEDWQKLFAHYQLPVTQFTEKGAPSFTDDFLATVEHPKVQLARRAGKIASLRSKFLLAYDEVIGDDCKLRFALHQLRGDEYGTTRGRFSMSGGSRGEPRYGANLQQVFRVNSQREAFGFRYDDDSHDDEIFLVRSLFEAEPYVRWDGSDTEYLSGDAQSIEYRLGAHFAESPTLLEAYQADFKQLEEGRLTEKWVDFHKVVGDVIRPYKDLSRNIIKNANFCLLYGGYPGTLARTLGTSKEEATQIFDVWHRMFPELGGLSKKAEDLARKRGYVKTIYGRRARFKTAEHLQWAHAAINYCIQGSAADLMKKKLVELHKARKLTGLLMRMTVHDEICGDARYPETQNLVRKILNQQTTPLKVPIVWEVETGKNWAKAH